MKSRGLTTAAALVVLFAVLIVSAAYATFVRTRGGIDSVQVPVVTLNAKRGAGPAVQLPKMVELYADWCPPCRDMKPILDQLEKDYKGKVQFQRINIDENKDAVKTYNIKAIPVQLFYDSSGKLALRHEGFYSRDQIVAQFKKMGVK